MSFHFPVKGAEFSSKKNANKHMILNEEEELRGNIFGDKLRHWFLSQLIIVRC